MRMQPDRKALTQTIHPSPHQIQLGQSSVTRMEGLGAHLHDRLALINSQMAPHNEHSMEAITGKDFFTHVSREGYPASKPKAQPWRHVWTGPRNKNTPDGKMVVACALRHDYGMGVRSQWNDC